MFGHRPFHFGFHRSISLDDGLRRYIRAIGRSGCKNGRDNRIELFRIHEGLSSLGCIEDPRIAESGANLIASSTVVSAAAFLIGGLRGDYPALNRGGGTYFSRLRSIGAFCRPEAHLALLLLILVLVLLFGGGGYYGYRNQYYGGGILGLLLTILLIVVLLSFINRAAFLIITTHAAGCPPRELPPLSFLQTPFRHIRSFPCPMSKATKPRQLTAGRRSKVAFPRFATTGVTRCVGQ